MISERWRGSLPLVAAVAVVAALSLLTVTVMSGLGGGGDESAFVHVDADVDDSTSATEAPRRRAPRPTSTTTTTTTSAPEVLGDTVEREPDGEAPAAGTSTAAPDPDGIRQIPRPTSPRTPTPPAPAPAPRPPARVTSPTTTTQPPAPPTTVCRNSTNPACGKHTWSPAPGTAEVEVVEVEIPTAVQVGVPVTFAIDYVDPAGPDALGACINWSAPDAVTNISHCTAIKTDCARYGPHDPPARRDALIPVESEFVFDTPGTYEVTVGGNLATHLADGCTSPYQTTMDTRTFTITVT